MVLKLKQLGSQAHSVRGIRRGRTMKTISYLNRKRTNVVFCSDDQRSIPWHDVFVFLILVLADVLQMHCQGSNKSPFQTHLSNMLAFLFALLLYCSALGYYIKSGIYLAGSNSKHLKVSADVTFVSGSLASASLISVVVPRSFELPVFIIWIVSLTLYLARNIILNMSKYPYYSCKNSVSIVYSMWKRIIGSTNGGSTTVTI